MWGIVVFSYQEMQFSFHIKNLLLFAMNNYTMAELWREKLISYTSLLLGGTKNKS